MFEIQLEYFRHPHQTEVITFPITTNFQNLSELLDVYINSNVLQNSDFKLTLKGNLGDYFQAVTIKMSNTNHEELYYFMTLSMQKITMNSNTFGVATDEIGRLRGDDETDEDDLNAYYEKEVE